MINRQHQRKGGGDQLVIPQSPAKRGKTELTNLLSFLKRGEENETATTFMDNTKYNFNFTIGHESKTD